MHATLTTPKSLIKFTIDQN